MRLSLCGASNVFADLSTAAPAVTREAAVLRDPELILVSAPPDSAREWLAEWGRFPSLAAVRNGLVAALRRRALDRMGPSVVEATASLCAVIDRARQPAPPAP